MSRSLRAVLVVVLVSASVGCDGATPDAAPSLTAPVSPTSPGELAPPPLRLPSVAPGEGCPLATPQLWSSPGQAGRVLGSGPLYPVADYFGGGAVLGLRPSDRQPDGRYVKKVRWIGAGYTGPVLVRTGRIDGPGTASVKFSYTGEARDDGYFAVLTNEDTDLPATTTVSGPGCYAYQVDGTTFSTTIVFRAEPQDD